MRKSGLISLVVILFIISALFYLPYIEFLAQEHKFRHDNQLLDYLYQDNFGVKLCLLTLLFPLVLMIESTFWNESRSIWKRVILVIQSALIIWGGYIVWFLMSFNIFTGMYELKAPYYLILVYLILGVVWNILLAIPYFDKKLISGIFNKLSLTKDK